MQLIDIAQKKRNGIVLHVDSSTFQSHVCKVSTSGGSISGGIALLPEGPKIHQILALLQFSAKTFEVCLGKAFIGSPLSVEATMKTKVYFICIRDSTSYYYVVVCVLLCRT